MTTETLSDKKWFSPMLRDHLRLQYPNKDIEDTGQFFFPKDVREFIRQLKGKLCLDNMGICEGQYKGGTNLCNNCRKINELAGPRLVGEGE